MLGEHYRVEGDATLVDPQLDGMLAGGETHLATSNPVPVILYADPTIIVLILRPSWLQRRIA